MDKLIAIEEMEFDLSTASTANQNLEIDPEKYRNYLAVNPIWNFLSLSKDEYFKMSIEDRKSHIQNYYRHMLNGKIHCFVQLFFFFGLVI